MEHGLYFIEYELFGMKKSIVFQCASQYRNWSWALEQLNDSDYEAFKIVSIKQERD